MKYLQSALIICLGMLVVLAAGCSSAPEEKATLTPDSPQLKAFAPVPAMMEDDSNPITEEKITLGRMLYYEPRLSKGQDIACNDCHQLDKYGVDGEPTSEGHKGQRGDRNSPTVYH